jgi:endoglucanase
MNAAVFKGTAARRGWLLALILAGTGIAAEPPIRLNTIGFLPGRPKQASIASPCTNFSVIRQKDGQVVFSGSVTGPRRNVDTGEDVYVSDFSACDEPGEYLLDVPGVGRSAVFKVGHGIYDAPFYTVMRGFYLWRCGMAVSGTHNGRTFAHAACHTNDAWLDYVAGGHEKRNSTGGWHDAGDYNKYVVNAGVSVGVMLRAWEDFGDRLKTFKLDLPEAGGKTPEYLAELKWELDWLLTMQDADGSVWHKVSTRNFDKFEMPEQEKEDRYFVPWSSAATANFVAMMAMAARDFAACDPVFADRCLKAAEKSYSFLSAHPGNHRSDQSAFTTGTYTVFDADARTWAAAELWETTARPDCLKDFETRIRASRAGVDTEWDYGNMKNLGTLTYLFSKRDGRDAVLMATLRSNLLATADSIVATGRSHGYARPMGTRYGWGFNGTVARQVVILQAANRLRPGPEYIQCSLDALGFLFGRNVDGRSFVTGLGFKPPMNPHDRRSGADGVSDPWPGYLVGGPNANARDWKDVEEDYRNNEIAINWNAALVYALAGFIGR